MPGCDSGNGVPSRWEAFRSSSSESRSVLDCGVLAEASCVFVARAADTIGCWRSPVVWQVWPHELLPVREGRPWSAMHVGTNPEVLLTEPIEGIVDATGDPTHLSATCRLPVLS